MKKIFTTLLSLTCLATISAQVEKPIQDSLDMSARYANDVYYSLYNGTVKTESNSNWQLAFSIGSFNVAARANTASMSGGNGSVKAYAMPDMDTLQWNSFDSTGYASWDLMDNSDTDWQDGAFNQGSTGQFDYGWGAYNASSHKVVGHRLYLLEVTNGMNITFKKIWIKEKTKGVWIISSANIDGSSAHITTIKSSDYIDKNFAYYNVLTNQVLDREPKSKDWDIVLTRYASFQPGSGIYYASTGILSNNGIVVAKADKIDTKKVKWSNHVKDTSSSISAIGYNWKKLNFQTFKWEMEDSLLYFAKDHFGRYWKLQFTGFSGSSSGKVYLTKEQLTFATDVNNLDQAVSLAVYPNPAQNIIHILTEEKEADVTISDLSGHVIIREQTRSFKTAIAVNSLTAGIYLVRIETQEGSALQRFVKQ